MKPTFNRAGRNPDQESEDLDRLLDELDLGEAIKSAELSPSPAEASEWAVTAGDSDAAGDVAGAAASLDGSAILIDASGGSTFENRKSEISGCKKSEQEAARGIQEPGNTRRRRGGRRSALATTRPDLLVSRPWVRQIDEVKILIHQIGLDAAGQSFRFSVRFHRAVLADAMKAKKTFSTWANDRLSYYLEPLEHEQRLGRELLFWFSVERSPAGHLHVHGAIGVEEKHLGDLRDALRRFSGRALSGVQLDSFNDNASYGGCKGSLGWARYASKRFRRRPKDPRLGSQLVCLRSLSRRSRPIWEEIRADYRRRGAAAIADISTPSLAA